MLPEDKSQHHLPIEDEDMTDLAQSPFRDEEKCPDIIPRKFGHLNISS